MYIRRDSEGAIERVLDLMQLGDDRVTGDYSRLLAPQVANLIAPVLLKGRRLLAGITNAAPSERMTNLIDIEFDDWLAFS